MPLSPNPENASEVLWTITVRIPQDKAEAGFGLVATMNGWTPETGMTAMEFCEEQVKNYIRQSNAMAIERLLEQQKQEQLSALLAEF